MKALTTTSLSLLSIVVFSLPVFSDDKELTSPKSAALTVANNTPIDFLTSSGISDGTEIIRLPGNSLRFRYNNPINWDARGDHPIRVRDSADAIVFNLDPNSHIYFKNSGNVGIGTTSPTEALEVVGNIKGSGDISTSGDIVTTGDVGVGTTSPTEALEVVGNIKLSGNILFSGDLCLGTGC